MRKFKALYHVDCVASFVYEIGIIKKDFCRFVQPWKRHKLQINYWLYNIGEHLQVQIILSIMYQTKRVEFFVLFTLMHVIVFRIQQQFELLLYIWTLIRQSLHNPHLSSMKLAHADAIQKEVKTFDCHFLVVVDSRVCLIHLIVFDVNFSQLFHLLNVPFNGTVLQKMHPAADEHD